LFLPFLHLSVKYFSQTTRGEFWGVGVELTALIIKEGGMVLGDGSEMDRSN